MKEKCKKISKQWSDMKQTLKEKREKKKAEKEATTQSLIKNEQTPDLESGAPQPATA